MSRRVDVFKFSFQDLGDWIFLGLDERKKAKKNSPKFWGSFSKKS